MTYPEPSTSDHNAPWNWNDDEECCECSSCIRSAKEEAKADRTIDDYEYDRDWR